MAPPRTRTDRLRRVRRRHRAAVARSRFRGVPDPPRGDALLTGMSKIPEMIDAATAVRAAGYRTAILTNNIKEWGAWRQIWDADNLVDVVVDSCEVDMRKPNADIFELDRRSLAPASAPCSSTTSPGTSRAPRRRLQTMHVTDPVPRAAAAPRPLH